MHYQFSIPEQEPGKTIGYSQGWAGRMGRCPQSFTVDFYDELRKFGVAHFEDPDWASWLGENPQDGITLLSDNDAQALIDAANNPPRLSISQNQSIREQVDTPTEVPMTMDGLPRQVWIGAEARSIALVGNEIAKEVFNA